METEKDKKLKFIGLIAFFSYLLFSIHPVIGIMSVLAIIVYIKNNPTDIYSYFSDFLNIAGKSLNEPRSSDQLFTEKMNQIKPVLIPPITNILLSGNTKRRLEKRKKYLHIALNNSIEEAREIISQLPASERIIIEAGTPLIKIYGIDAVIQIRLMAPSGSYIVADNKCADLAAREVEMMASAGANAVTCLGVAPIETIDSFIEECQKSNIDSMIDMMNVENALSVLKRLKK